MKKSEQVLQWYKLSDLDWTLPNETVCTIQPGLTPDEKVTKNVHGKYNSGQITKAVQKLQVLKAKTSESLS